MHILVIVQVTDSLRNLLDKDGIEYTQKIFDADKGIEDLGPNPFVSYPWKQVGLVTVNFQEGYRIFYISMYEEFARRLLCEVWHCVIYS